MEDRHYLSEPRSTTDVVDKPTWEVDVYREGVPDPVLTLLVSNDTLPPRMRKKRVVWKLPDTQKECPNFGSDEKKRLMELFKNEKKNEKKRKKKGLKRLSSSSPTTEETQTLSQKEKEERLSNNPAYEPALCNEEEEKEDGEKPATPEVSTAAPPIPPRAPRVTPPPGMAPMPAETHPGRAATPSTVSTTQSDSPPNNSSRPAPPGFSLAPLSLNNDESCKTFTVPSTSTNVPVDLASDLIDMYYSCMQNGQADELLHYFLLQKAVKSLSLGGAHSFCHSRMEILSQLTSLSGSSWEIGSVVAQEGYQESVVVLVTGTCLPKTAPRPLPFCHSITLIRAPFGGGYQIHNDAMALTPVLS